MKSQKTLTIALASLGLFGVAGAALIAGTAHTVPGTATKIYKSAEAYSNSSNFDLLISNDIQKNGSGCNDLFAEQQAGPRGGGGQMGGGQQGGPTGQGGPGMGMRMGGAPQGPMILRDPKVQEELKLSEQQIGQIQQVLNELRPPMQGGPGGGESGENGPRGGQGQQGGQRGQGGQHGQGQPGGPGGQNGELIKQFEEKLKTILNQNQFNRYQQLTVQAAGPGAFLRPDVVEKLELSESQLQQMREIFEANRPEPPQFSQGGGSQGQPPIPPDNGEMKAKQDVLMSKLLQVLNSQQRSTWQTLVGQKFEFTQGQQRRGGPGGGRGEGGGSNTENVSIVF